MTCGCKFLERPAMKIKSLSNQGIRNSSVTSPAQFGLGVNLKLIDRRIYISNAGVWEFWFSWEFHVIIIQQLLNCIHLQRLKCQVEEVKSGGCCQLFRSHSVKYLKYLNVKKTTGHPTCSRLVSLHLCFACLFSYEDNDSNTINWINREFFDDSIHPVLSIVGKSQG